jgi:hypothetical protein
VVAERAKNANNDEFLIEKSSRGTGAFGSTGGAWWLRRGAFGSTSGTTALAQPSLA